MTPSSGAEPPGLTPAGALAAGGRAAAAAPTARPGRPGAAPPAGPPGVAAPDSAPPAGPPGAVPAYRGAARSGRGASRARARAPGEPRRIAYLYLAPALLFYLVFAFGPLLYTVWLSFWNWDGLSEGVWVGLDNYKTVLGDSAILKSFGHSFVLIAFYALLPICLGLTLASILAHGRVRGVSAFRAVFFLPQVIATVVVAVAWGWVYAANGPINEALRALGMGSVARSWLGDFDFALPALGMVGAWTTFGLCTTLFLAGIQKVPTALYEAARVDGAGRLREFFAVTLPHLRGELSVVLILTIILGLRTFDLIYVATAGGPGTSTTVPSYLVYQNAFAIGRVGLAAAIAVVLTVLIFALTAVVAKLVDRDVRA